MHIEQLEKALKKIATDAGGVAFVDGHGPTIYTPLRDQFAMAALVGLYPTYNKVSPITIATEAYEVADAMLKARKESADER